jgi:hypothetical protein
MHVLTLFAALTLRILNNPSPFMINCFRLFWGCFEEVQCEKCSFVATAFFLDMNCPDVQKKKKNKIYMKTYMNCWFKLEGLLGKS